MVQQDWRHLGSAGIQPLAWSGGLGIQDCPSCSLGPNCGLDLIPGLGVPHATGQPKKKKKLNSQCKSCFRSSFRGTEEMDLTRFHEDMGSIPGLAQWVKDPALP